MNETAEVTQEIRRMSRLLALVATKGLDSREAVPLLAKAGYTQNEIGSILGMTRSAVNQTMIRRRRGSGVSRRPVRVNGDEN